MNISQLVEILKALPQDARVVVRGYEGGVNDVYRVDPVLINVNQDKGDLYMGCHGRRYKEDDDNLKLIKGEAFEIVGENPR